MKRVVETSREAFGELQHELQPREAAVLDGLGNCRRAHDRDPTAYELLRFMQVEKPTLDLNAVRPRLTALRDTGYVETTGKRTCAVTGKRVFVWAMRVSPPQPAPYSTRTTVTPAAQQELF